MFNRYASFIINDYFAKAKRQTIWKLLGEKQKIDKLLCLKENILWNIINILWNSFIFHDASFILSKVAW